MEYTSRKITVHTNFDDGNKKLHSASINIEFSFNNAKVINGNPVDL